MEKWQEISGYIVNTIKNRSLEFWTNNAPARAFVEERAERLAKLSVQYAEAGDIDRAAIRNQMALVSETIETELLALALIGNAEAKKAFIEIVKGAFGILVKVLPVILSSI